MQHSMAAKRGFTSFGWQLFVAMMNAGVSKEDLPDATPKAKQHRHCPRCNSTDIDTGITKHSGQEVYGLWLRCRNCGMEKMPAQKDWK